MEEIEMLDKNKVKVGIAPIGWTNDDMPDLGKENTFEQCVSEMALAGYSGCEIGNKYPKDKEVLKKALDLRGLTICNQWFSSYLISKPFEETANAFCERLDFLKYVGANVIGVSEQSYSIQGKDQPIFEGKYVMDDHEWDLLCNGLNRLGKIAKEKGMKLTFHHHMGTVVQNEDEIDRLMEHTDSNLVYLLFDSGHLGLAGIDPMKILNKYIKRVGHVHLKDLRNDVAEKSKSQRLSFLESIRRGIFTVPGDGNLNFKPIFDCLEKANYTGWIVVEAEQDPAKANPLEYAMKARKYIREQSGI
jgi:inosose dehydratase